MSDSERTRIRPRTVDWVELVGVAAMVLLVGGSTLEEGSLVQRSLFLVAPALLLGVAYVNDELMLTALQIVVLLGSVLAFVPSLALFTRLAILLGAAVASTLYLVAVDYRKEDRFWPVGGSGLVLLAAGFAISGSHLLAFNVLIAVGSLVVGVYSTLGFVVLKVRIQAIWIVLNVAFAITPGLRVISFVT